MTPFLSLVVAALAVALGLVWRRARNAARADFIRQYAFPVGLYDKLHRKRPELTPKDCQLAGRALRQFFLAHLKSGRRFVSMPSQVADDLWHELILHTKSYQRFCQGAFGRFMHHTPAVALGSGRTSNAGLRRCWWYACREENINPRQPTRLPLLFALDAKLGVEDGFRYLPDCRGFQAAQGAAAGIIYCGGDFASLGVDGSADGFGDASGDDGGGDGDGGGGCGGGGCGGGGD